MRHLVLITLAVSVVASAQSVRTYRPENVVVNVTSYRACPGGVVIEACGSIAEDTGSDAINGCWVSDCLPSNAFLARAFGAGKGVIVRASLKLDGGTP